MEEKKKLKSIIDLYGGSKIMDLKIISIQCSNLNCKLYKEILSLKEKLILRMN